MNYKELIERLNPVLLKKAEGYFYQEETCEYQTSDSSCKKEKTKNITKNVSPKLENENQGLQSNQEEDEANNPKEKETNLVLFKKKVTTHHVPPDMLAIKMLVEIYGQKIDGGDDLEKLSDQELLKLKKDIINKLKKLD